MPDKRQENANMKLRFIRCDTRKLMVPADHQDPSFKGTDFPSHTGD